MQAGQLATRGTSEHTRKHVVERAGEQRAARLPLHDDFPGDVTLKPSQIEADGAVCCGHLSTREYARLVNKWVSSMRDEILESPRVRH